LKNWDTRKATIADKVESWLDMSIGPVGLALQWHETGKDPNPELTAHSAINIQLKPSYSAKLEIYNEDVEVSGIQYRLSDAIAFAKGNHHRLLLQRDPQNEYDRNAIMVIGISAGWVLAKSRFIGYIPKAIAAHIARKGLSDKLEPRLRNVYVSKDWDYVAIRFDLVGPKNLAHKYKAK
jgi:hypothetical protein